MRLAWDELVFQLSSVSSAQPRASWRPTTWGAAACLARRAADLCLSPSFPVLDAQHPTGEGVPAEAGESPSHHRPDQWDLSSRRLTGRRGRRTLQLREQAPAAPRKKPTSLETHRDARVLREGPLASPVCRRAAPAAPSPRAGRRRARG